MDIANAFNLAANTLVERLRKNSKAILLPLCIANSELGMFEIHIGDTESDGFGNPESAAVHESDGELVLGRNAFEQPFNFLLG